jgi:hypothetical protein
MEKIQPVEKLEEMNENLEERKEIPFGADGAAFLRNLMQHALFLGFVAIILIIIRMFGTR